MRLGSLVVVIGALAAWGLGCSPGTPRDVVPETHDVRITDPDGGGATTTAKPGAYAYVAKRAHGAIGLAGTKNIADADAKRIVDTAADELERCARAQESSGALVDGAARVVVAGTASGTRIGDTELAPGGAVAANALLCLIAPLRAATFPPANGAAMPAILVEATWGPIGTTSTTSDAGPPPP